MNQIRRYTLIAVAACTACMLLCARKINEPLDTLMPFGTITGVVTDKQGAELAGVNVRVEANGQSCMTGADGEFTLNGVPSGTHRLFFVRAGYRDTSVAGISVGNGQNQVLARPVVMNVATAVIKGTVTSNGMAKAGVGVAVVNQSAATLTGVGGAFTLAGVQADASILIAADGGVGYNQQNVTLAPGETLDVNISITASKDGGIITGIVVNEAGQPQAGVMVSAVGGGIRDTTGADGSYILQNVPVNVPIDVATSNGGRVGGLVVNANGMLTNINVPPAAVIGTGAVTISSGAYIVPLGSAVTVTAAFTGGGAVAWILWDIDNDNAYDTITSTPMLSPSFSSTDTFRIIGFGVVTTAGDTIAGGRITITRVSPRPAADATPADTTIKRRQALTLVGRADCRTGGVKSFAWDFDGDGTLDWMRPDGGTVTHRFNTSGTFYSTFVVTGTNGESGTDTAIIRVGTDSVAVSDSDLVPPEITNLQPFDTVPPFVDVMLDPMPPAGVVYALLIGRRRLDSLILGQPGMYLIVLEQLSEGPWYLQPGAIKGSDTAWGDVVQILVKRQPPYLGLSSPVGGAVAAGDSVWLKWGGWSHNSMQGSLIFNVRFDDNFPPGVDYAQGIASPTGSCSLRVAPANGWSDSTMYYWEIIAIDSIDTISAIDSFLYIIPTLDTTWGGVSIVQGPPLNVVRTLPLVVVCSDGSIAVMGGHDQAWNVLSTADILAPGATSFTTVSMNFAHDGGAIARLKNGRYILAGTAGNLGTAGSTGNTVETFDPVTKAFTPLSSMTYERASPGMGVLENGMALVVGGWYNDNAAAYGEIYNPTAGTFTLTAAMNYPHSRPLVIPCKDTTALIISGYTATSGPAYELIEQYSPARNGFTVFATNFIEGDPGWRPFWYDYYMCDLAEQKDAQGRYVLMASRDNQYALASVDPATKTRALIATVPPLPSADSVVFLKGPLIDAAANRAYLIAWDATTRSKLRVYRVDLASGLLTEPRGWLTPSGTFGFANPAAALMPDGKIFIAGGTPDGGYNKGTTNTWVITPK